MKFKRLSTTTKLYLSLLTLLLLLTCPFFILCIRCFSLHEQTFLSKLLIIVLSALCLILAFFTSYFFIISPIAGISKAATEIFKNYIDSSIVRTNTHADAVDSRHTSDDTVRLMHHVQHIMDKEYKAEMLRKQAELNALQSQINPHFLYNTLESIRGQAVCEGVDTIADMAKSLSDFFRYSIQSKAPLVSLNEELHIVESYIKIQNYRFNNKYQVSICLDDENLRQIGIPRLTLQPIVENALLHGLRNSLRTAEHVYIHAYSTQKRVIITVHDEGCGIDEDLLEKMNFFLSQPFTVGPESVKNGTSIGLNNINERIKLHYGNEYGVKLFSSLNYGTTVEISLPLTNIE